MPNWYRGSGTRLGSGLEVVAWGTIAARTAWQHVVNASGLAEAPTWLRRPYLALSSSSSLLPLSTSHVLVALDVSPKVTLPLRYRGIGQHLAALLGTPVDAGGPTYTHTYTIGDPDSLPSLTLEYIRGDSGNSEIFLGCMATKGTLVFQARQLSTLEIEYVGKCKSAARTAAGTPTDGDLDEVLPSEVGTISWGGNTYYPKSVRVFVDNQLQRREFLGSQYTLQPRSTGRSIQIQATMDIDDAFYTAFLAGTSGDLTFASTGGTSPDALSITAENCMIVEYSDDIKDQGIQEVTVTWEVRCDTTGTGGFTLVLTNPDATYDLN